MTEWIFERGIGEDRAVLIDNGKVIASRVFWPGALSLGSLVTAKVAARTSSSGRGLCIGPDGTEINVTNLPRDASEGSQVEIVITREAMAEAGRYKLAQGRHSGDDKPIQPLQNARQVARLPSRAWEDVWSLAREASLDFAGGSLVLSATPAMTLIDVDGHGTPRELALAAVPAIAQALRWLDIGGSIGIDFPTIPVKAERKLVDNALTEALLDWDHERTAMNGFGFVQIVARLVAPSLLNRLTYSRAGASARMLLRQAEMVGEPGTLLLTCHPAVKAKLRDEWLAELGKRTGRHIQIETDPKLALEAGFAQAVSS